MAVSVLGQASKEQQIWCSGLCLVHIVVGTLAEWYSRGSTGICIPSGNSDLYMNVSTVVSGYQPGTVVHS